VPKRLGPFRPLDARRRHPRGQSLVEFALILPILLMLVGGIVQYGIIFATKHSLIQVGRDVGRWAATQGYVPCNAAAIDADPQPVTQADHVAEQSRLMGYASGDWNADDAAHFKVYPDNSVLDPSPPSTQSVEVLWSIDTGTCPPLGSNDVAWITIRLAHRAPVVLPGFPYLPGLGTCDADGCYFMVTTTAEFRMEPVAGS
jgi:hypothetical protein